MALLLFIPSQCTKSKIIALLEDQKAPRNQFVLKMEWLFIKHVQFLFINYTSINLF